MNEMSTRIEAAAVTNRTKDRQDWISASKNGRDDHIGIIITWMNGETGQTEGTTTAPEDGTDSP